jgi:hypothetical protein
MKVISSQKKIARWQTASTRSMSDINIAHDGAGKANFLM